jgi:lysozyme family protein
MMRFEECLKFICESEGGYVNDPLDRGGATNYGITERVYHDWLEKRDLPIQSVTELTPREMAQIYYDLYWIEDLPYGLDLAVFDSAVQHGKSRAVKWLQGIVGVATDGILGEDTMYHINDYILRESLAQLIKVYLDRRKQFYMAIIVSDPKQSRFKRGWDNRMTHLQEVLNGVQEA